ncbi:MAG TPA: glycosyltransferase [Candidatus Omnitrophota bacterium]|nr:glycosyltransferase [Candidatus Omnitrophota bacterium]HPS19548.1 glycosyltransferase [Candidatus Omnitrophota bacterium]
MQNKIDILILNYNGKSLLESYLGSVVEAASLASAECGVYVVDNRSSDGSVEYVRANYPSVKVIVAAENKVLISYNDVVKDLASNIVIFLNNDMSADKGFIDPLVAEFKDPKVMFAAPRIMNFDGTYNGGRSYMKLSAGAIKVVVDEGNYMKSGETCAISTGAFRREMFLELGGFDDLYLPGIWEDVDICFRGLIKGYKGKYVPQSVIYHAESTTFHREYGTSKKMVIAHRNMFLFLWKNIIDKRILLSNIFLSVPRALFLFLKGNPEILYGLFAAVWKIKTVMTKRKEWLAGSPLRVMKDSDLIK